MDNNLIKSITNKIEEIDKLYNIDLDLTPLDLEFYGLDDKNMLDTFEKLNSKELEEHEFFQNEYAKNENLTRERINEIHSMFGNPSKLITKLENITEENAGFTYFYFILMEQRKAFNSLKQDINKLISQCNKAITGEVATAMALESNIHLNPYLRNTIASYVGGKKVNKKRKTKKRKTK